MCQNIDFNTNISNDDRFIISLINLNDIPDIVNMLKNPNVCEFLYFAPAPEEFYAEYFEDIYEEIYQALSNDNKLKKAIFVVRDAKSGEFIGNGGVVDVDMVDDVYEIGYQIDEKYWGKGIGTFICSILIDFSFSYMKARRLNADCYSKNIGSIKILEKNGFLQEGCLRKFYKSDSGYNDKIIFGLLRED